MLMAKTHPKSRESQVASREQDATDESTNTSEESTEETGDSRLATDSAPEQSEGGES